jgi:hypothetical protein
VSNRARFVQTSGVIAAILVVTLVAAPAMTAPA